MSALPAAVIEAAVSEAGLTPLSPGVAEQFSRFADVLLRWNAKLNLTAIRTPEEILRRHFLECIFCAQHLPAGTASLLDYGSGAGFPGIPIALCRTEIRVTLAESQAKKAAFLREAVRTLGLDAKVFYGRVVEMAPERVFDVVTLRAVDKMKDAVNEAMVRVVAEGNLVLLTTAGLVQQIRGFDLGLVVQTPGMERGVMAVMARKPMFHVEH